MRPFRAFRDFYPYYLNEHQNRTCRRLHFLGTASVLVTAFALLVSRLWAYLWLLPVVGYAPAWIGHFFFEKNRPATFRHPLYSLRGDFRMFREMLLGRHW